MATSPLHTDPVLIEQIAGGDSAAFRVLFNAHWDRIFSVALAFTKSTERSEELVQDVFLKIWLNRTELPGIRNFEGYLFTVARNHIFNALRTRLKEVSFGEELEHYFKESSLADDLLLLKDAEALVHKGVEALPGQQRAVFEMSRFQGLNTAEIAEKLNISPLTVKVHLRKALAALRTFLQQHAAGMVLLLALYRLLEK
ncbi:RNA polymerase sigma factor [Parasegetibacter sp. NRK P23]|uniref:RNA polymerase sigma factor n=1 Tax=Parasegetibacter sp. NRK P23 TaxID=2942999 RepID=UPI0020431DAC|nr:RNA polymerase sigma-70 factor [Parasegetibacter sp. NRK P23]MCM5529110.1 RNA polymerase sigma-70 factor [Parasegetibacter sp. NRK P23]